MAAREVAAEAALAPHNLEAEASVLGSILISEPALDAILIDVKLRAEDFYRARHAHIYRAMLALKNSAVPQAVDPVTVCEQLERDGRLEEVGGPEYVRSLPVSVAAVANAPDYARIVRENAQLRRLLSATQEIQSNVFGRAGDARELLERAETQLYRITADEHASELRSIEDVLHDEVGRLERVSKEGISLTGTPTGFRQIDDLTGGLQPGNLIVLAARPSLGKSALALNIAENAAVQHGRPVALFSLEMSEAELAQRLIASRARQNSDDLRKGKVNPSGWSKIMKANEKLASAPLWVDDSSDLGILELRAKARRLHMREHLGLIVIDYLQLMRPEDSRAGRVEQIGQLSRGLKILARELDVPVLALSQLSRAVEQRPDKRPLLSDLRESGSIEQDADVVAFIYREDKYDRESERIGEADIIFAKHRNGPVGEVTLTFVERFAMFSTPVSQDAVLGSGGGAAGNGADRRPDLRVVGEGKEPSISAAPDPGPAPDGFGDDVPEDEDF